MGDVTVDPIVVGKDEEIAHLKELLAFANRGNSGPGSVRVEVAFPADPVAPMTCCVTAPGADEKVIANTVIRYLLSGIREANDERVHARAADLVAPILTAAMACREARHVRRGDGYCQRCLNAPMQAAAEAVNATQGATDTTTEPLP